MMIIFIAIDPVELQSFKQNFRGDRPCISAQNHTWLWCALLTWSLKYCMFAQGKIIRFYIAPGDLQSKGLCTTVADATKK